MLDLIIFSSLVFSSHHFLVNDAIYHDLSLI